MQSTSSPIPASAGPKRKRDTGPKFYAVKSGEKPGIYHNWADCFEQVKGHKGALFKSFPSLSEAEFFLKHGLSKESSVKGTPSKFYGIREGRVPGIYTDWDTAQAQIRGWTKPKYQKFATREEAEAFVQGVVHVKEEDGEHGKANAPIAKKQKRTSAILDNSEIDESVEPGSGPLPAGSEDGFDRRVTLDEKMGMTYKNDEQRNAMKMHAIGPAEGSALRIYTDGSTLGNGGAEAIAGVGVYFGAQDPRNISEALIGPRQTNQRAELTAVSRAVDIAPRNRDIEIYTDSKYAINCVTIWSPNWRRNGWKSANKQDVQNRDLVELIINKIEERDQLGVKTSFQWIKGHANDPGNIAADKLATDASYRARMGGALDAVEGIEAGDDAAVEEDVAVE